MRQLHHKPQTLELQSLGEAGKRFPVQSWVSDFWTPDAGLMSVTLEAAQRGGLAYKRKYKTINQFLKNALAAMVMKPRTSCMLG